MKITHCQVNHLSNPLGYALTSPRFTYLVEDAVGKTQVGARVEVFTSEGELCYDTGFCSTAVVTGIQTDMKLQPCTRYNWQVTVRTDCGEEATSALNWFETGKMGTSWTGSWLTHPRSQRMPVFSRFIPVSKPLKNARLYVCGLGLYEAFLTEQPVNDSRFLTPDRKIGQERFAPYCNNYNAWLQYQTYDITEQLQAAPFLHIWLGQGWYLGRFGFKEISDEDTFYGESFKLIADVVLAYEDGSVETLGTDEIWQVWPSNICRNNIYDGETLDDTLPAEQPAFATVFAGTMPPLTDRYSLPVVEQEKILPVELLTTPAGEQVFDLGQNITGVFALEVRPQAGDEIHIQVGEVLQGGNFYRDNLRTAKAEYRYLSDGTVRVIQPKFTFYGCRYIKVSGVRDLKKTDLTALICYSSMDRIGTIQTGHKKINQLLSNAHWGLKGNFLDVPTDCPQRDERMGWTGDAQVFAPTACYFRDAYAFYRKYLFDMQSEQKALGGKVPIVVPSFGYRDTACVWGDAAAMIPWTVYWFTGDPTILHEQYESMKSWVDYIQTLDGYDHEWGKQFHYGDWLALDHANREPGQCKGGTDEAFIAYVYYGHSAGLVAETAEILNRSEDALHYQSLKDQIYDYVRREYFTASGRCAVDTQTGLLISLEYSIAPNREKAIQQLQNTFSRNDNHLQTGFVGTPHLCNVLTQIGMERLAYDLLLYEGYPGWLYTVNMGATTMWERWNSMNPDGSVSSTGMNSFNHYAYGSIAEWMFRHMTGLQPLEPGFQKVRIAPVCDRRMGYVDMYYRSAAGIYRIHWAIAGKDEITLTVTIPFGCEAELQLYGSSGDRIPLTAGTYSYCYTSQIPLAPTFSGDSKLFALLDDSQAAEVLAKYGVTRDRFPQSHLQDTLWELAESVECRLSADEANCIHKALRKL